jgi:hypothetical protein
MKFIKYSLYILIVILAGILAVFFMSNEESGITVDPVPEIKQSILSSDKNQDLSLADENIAVTHIGGAYARASLIDTDTNFYLIKINNTWSNVITSDGPIYCEKAERLGFPINLVDDCVLQYPDSVTLNEYINDSNYDATIIVTVSENQDPFCDCLTVEDDGGEFTFVYSGDTEYLVPGDIIVIDVTDNEIVEIIDDESNNNSNEDNDSNSGGNTYINPNPETISGENLDLYFIDIDHSQKAIQFRND